MSEIMDDHNDTYLRLKRVSTVGFSVALIWVGLLGGALLLNLGDMFGWLGLATGAILLVLPLTTPFRRYWNKGDSSKIYPLLILVANLTMILMYGGFTAVFLSDPFVFYNEQDKMNVILWGVASLLSLGALVANLIEYRLDRKAQEAV